MLYQILPASNLEIHYAICYNVFASSHIFIMPSSLAEASSRRSWNYQQYLQMYHKSCKCNLIIPTEVNKTITFIKEKPSSNNLLLHILVFMVTNNIIGSFQNKCINDRKVIVYKIHLVPHPDFCLMR